MKKNILNFLFLVLIIPSIYVGYLHLRDYHSPGIIRMALEEALDVKNNYNEISREIYSKKVYLALVGFSNGMTKDEVNKMVKPSSFKLSDLGYDDSNYFCNITISVETEEKIICDLSHDPMFGGNIIISKNKNKEWVCKYTGLNKNKPPLCI